ncbi:toxin-antitoxin system antitoxin HicB [Ligilactobacillus salitolerans]|uniref:Toxin-antitoxin system antitoxin HicB n=1 Tax=Ligilactobacillus salitolerans TaxID=1808352 RepID=A0A401IW46_9LACO|nr:type II toxin-antitoxin system HicB family antitoxin [Ligilactobacillus salitolerans]GBG95770.1 toxin-antitoxin system antitoxin HicB [Ligilactobacillus salitolerans]
MDKGTVIYPVILKPDGEYVFVRVPDLEGGFTQGSDSLDAITMAQDLIGNLLEDSENYPRPSDPQQIKLAEDEMLVYVSTDLAAFRQKYSKKVRRNISIPEYLNKIAKEKGTNVSEVTTEALKAKYGF